MEFFQSNESAFRSEEQLEELICELQTSLEACLATEAQFEAAAHFNPFDRQVEG